MGGVIVGVVRGGGRGRLEERDDVRVLDFTHCPCIALFKKRVIVGYKSTRLVTASYIFVLPVIIDQ